MAIVPKLAGAAGASTEPKAPETKPATGVKSYWAAYRRWSREHSFMLGTSLMIFALVTVYLFDRIFVTVPPGAVGVLWQRLLGGTVTSEVYGEGLHVILPFNQMYSYDTRLQEVTDTYEAISADGLVMKVEMSVRFRLVDRNVGYLHKFVGPDYIKKLIIPEVASTMRSVISNFTPEDLYSKKRQEIQRQIYDQVSRGLETIYDPDQPGRRFVTVETTLIRNVEIPTRVKEAIESKVEQFHKMLEYDYRIQREAKESIRRAIEAEGIKKFQQVVSELITPDLLTWKGIEATEELARSNNAKMVVIGGGKNGLPIILNTGDSPSAAALDKPVAPKPDDRVPSEDGAPSSTAAPPPDDAPMKSEAATGVPGVMERALNALSQKPVAAKP